MPDPTVLAYLAGVVDSDGCITIYKNTHYQRTHSESASPVYQPRLAIAQVEPEAVELSRDTFGGTIRHKLNNPGKSRQLLVWRADHNRFYEVVGQLLPYLRIKKAQAENALKLKAFRFSHSWTPPPIVEGEPTANVTQWAKAAGFDRSAVFGGCYTGAIPSVLRDGVRLVPLSFIPIYKARRATGGRPKRSPEELAEMEAIYLRGRELNRVGLRRHARP